MKASILPVGLALGAVTGGLRQRTWTDAMVGWAVLELLIYPARYQVNDMIGFEADQKHPGGKGRLPGPVECKRARFTASGAAALVRCGVAAVVVRAAERRLATVIIADAVAVCGAAAVYETLRAVATGRTGAVPPAPTPGIVAIWLTVGAGYAVRGVTGMAMACDLLDHRAARFLAILGWWAFGTAWVTSRWALEATDHGRLVSGHLEWTAGAGLAREHLLALVRWLPPQVDAPMQAVPDEHDGGTRGLGEWRAVARTRITAPWHVAALAAGGCAVGGAWSMVGGGGPARGRVLIGFAAGAASSAAVAASPPDRRRAAAVAAGGGLVALARRLALGRPLAGAVPWLALTATQVHSLRQCRDEVGRGGVRLQHRTSRLLRRADRWT